MDPSRIVYVTPEWLGYVPKCERKFILGQMLYPRVHDILARQNPSLTTIKPVTAKVTGMLLELDTTLVFQLTLMDTFFLQKAVQEAIDILERNHTLFPSRPASGPDPLQRLIEFGLVLLVLVLFFHEVLLARPHESAASTMADWFRPAFNETDSA